MMGTVGYWKSLPREVLLSLSWEVFETQLNKAFSHLRALIADLAVCRKLNWSLSMILVSLSSPMIL